MGGEPCGERSLCGVCIEVDFAPCGCYPCERLTVFRHVTTGCQSARSRRARASQRPEPKPHPKLALKRLRYPALPGQLRTRLPPDDVTFSGTTRRWEFNYQHWARIDWKQPEIKLRVEGLATDANCRYVS